MKQLWQFSLILVLGLLLVKCGESEEQPPDDVPPVDEVDSQRAFLNNLASMCGVELTGEGTYPDIEDQPDHDLLGVDLNIDFTICEEDEVHIDLYRDEYWHGTWIVEMREDGLHLFHDHLGDEREEEDLGEGDYHGYGGYADDRGNSYRQYFAADEVTAEMIPDAETNVWMMEVDLEAQQFIYYLERHEEPRFRAEFDMAEVM